MLAFANQPLQLLNKKEISTKTIYNFSLKSYLNSSTVTWFRFGYMIDVRLICQKPEIFMSPQGIEDFLCKLTVQTDSRAETSFWQPRETGSRSFLFKSQGGGKGTLKGPAFYSMLKRCSDSLLNNSQKSFYK